MPILNGSVVYRVQVVSNGQGQLVPERRSVTTVCVFKCACIHMPIPHTLEDMMVLGSPSRPLWAVVQSSPVLILPGIPGFKAVLMTATEFQHTSPIEVGIESCWAGSLNCPQVEFSSMILEAISTESSLFIRQNQLLHRFVGNFSLLPLRAPPSGTKAWQQVLRTVCVSRMVPVFIPYHGTEYFYILGGGWQKGTLYRAQVYGQSYLQKVIVHCLSVVPNSQDQGMSYLFFNGFPLDQMIKYFTLSYHGEFAFVTETEEVYPCEVLFLRPSLGWQAFSSLQALKGDSSYSMTHSLLTVFYDWDKQLSFSAFSFPLTCPFFWEHMADLPHPEPYNRIQQYLTRPPLVPTSLGLQTTASLATYQGLLHHLLQLHSDYIMDIGDPVHNPTWRWWKDKDYYFYMASNGVSSTGFNVEIGGYSRAYMSSEITFPDMVYLDRVSSFSFSIYIACGSAKHLSVEEKPRGGKLSDINYIWLSAEVSNNRYIHVSVTRNELFNRGAVLYKVTHTETKPKIPQYVLDFYNLQHISHTGLHRVPIYIGCPPGNRLAFDITTTLEQCANNNKRYFNCPKPDPIMPCFYYEDLFYPFFLIQDMVSGESERFLGRWMCQGKSPCGNMAAQSLEAPDYYFVIEVSNKGIDLSTYCDYALRFILHVHGFPLDPSRGLFYMLVCSLCASQMVPYSLYSAQLSLVRKGTWSEDVTAIYTMHGYRVKWVGASWHA
uniref:Cation channel sperm-associated protein subunit gamma n=1 Tax=Oncorhynchus tshawytscha TaxID=74940 RepID=A0A8C8MFC5_ONCTS